MRVVIRTRHKRTVRPSCDRTSRFAVERVLSGNVQKSSLSTGYRKSE